MKNKAKVIMAGLSIILVGCAGPTREDVNEFKSVNRGSIPKESILDFSACLYDGFSKSHSMFTDIDTKQQVRSDGYRVESFSGGRILIMSADILKTGHVELWESNSAALINTSGERDAFVSCLAQYRVRN